MRPCRSCAPTAPRDPTALPRSSAARAATSLSPHSARPLRAALGLVTMRRYSSSLLLTRIARCALGSAMRASKRPSVADSRQRCAARTRPVQGRRPPLATHLPLRESFTCAHPPPCPARQRTEPTRVGTQPSQARRRNRRRVSARDSAPRRRSTCAARQTLFRTRRAPPPAARPSRTRRTRSPAHAAGGHTRACSVSRRQRVMRGTRCAGARASSWRACAAQRVRPARKASVKRSGPPPAGGLATRADMRARERRAAEGRAKVLQSRPPSAPYLALVPPQHPRCCRAVCTVASGALRMLRAQLGANKTCRSLAYIQS